MLNLHCQCPEQLPNLIVIGAMKSGTTSLHHYLDLHPEIKMSRQKELNFFVEALNWKKGIAWYSSQFSSEAKIRGESSPAYSNFPVFKGVPQRMHSLVPNAKLIYLLRDPVDRIVSHYTHFYAEQREHRTLPEALSVLSDNFYVNRSRYFYQLSQYRDVFPDSQILVVTSASLSRFPQQTMRKIFQFLGVDPDFEFEFKADSLGRLLTFGPSITASGFRYNTKMHRSVWKRRLKLPNNHWAIRSLEQAIALLPNELACHVQKLAYWPFSERVERPAMEDELRSQLLDYLRKDIEQLQDYTGSDFIESWPQ